LSIRCTAELGSSLARTSQLPPNSFRYDVSQFGSTVTDILPLSGVSRLQLRPWPGIRVTARGTKMHLRTLRVYAFGEEGQHRLSPSGLSTMTLERDIGSVELDVNDTAAEHGEVSTVKMTEFCAPLIRR
jgi:hypothetical protein